MIHSRTLQVVLQLEMSLHDWNTLEKSNEWAALADLILQMESRNNSAYQQQKEHFMTQEYIECEKCKAKLPLRNSHVYNYCPYCGVLMNEGSSKYPKDSKCEGFPQKGQNR